VTLFFCQPLARLSWTVRHQPLPLELVGRFEHRHSTVFGTQKPRPKICPRLNFDATRYPARNHNQLPLYHSVSQHRRKGCRSIAVGKGSQVRASKATKSVETCRAQEIHHVIPGSSRSIQEHIVAPVTAPSPTSAEAPGRIQTCLLTSQFDPSYTLSHGLPGDDSHSILLERPGLWPCQCTRRLRCASNFIWRKPSAFPHRRWWFIQLPTTAKLCAATQLLWRRRQ